MTEGMYNVSETIKITGITNRQLRYWQKINLITASKLTKGGHSRFSFSDLIMIRTIRKLIDQGISIQKIRTSIVSIFHFLPTVSRPLTQLKLIATSDILLVIHEGTAFEALTGQEWVFPIAELQQDLENKINQLSDKNIKSKRFSPQQYSLFPTEKKQ